MPLRKAKENASFQIASLSGPIYIVQHTEITMSRHPTIRPKDGAMLDQPMPHNCDRAAWKIEETKMKLSICKSPSFKVSTKHLQEKRKEQVQPARGKKDTASICHEWFLRFGNQVTYIIKLINWLKISPSGDNFYGT